MPRYAKDTTVSIEKSRAEIEQTLRRYGATEFHFGWKPEASMIGFRVGGLFVRFILPLPKPDERRFTHKMMRGWEQKVSEAQAVRAHDQEIRQRWRALLLAIKAKLEAVECGISTIEQEFLAFVVMPDDSTIGQWFVGEILPQIRAGQMPAMLALPAPKAQE